ncbi:MAG TPA: hypothetical protein VGL40_13465 [Bacillota bacterium]
MHLIGNSLATLILVFIAGYIVVIRPWHLRWGATPEEVGRALPGDERVPEPVAQYTHAITIAAPAAEVWPWLVQIGCNRGGWYSYDWLDNGGRPSARQVIPEFQHLEVGQMIPAAPSNAAGFPVAAVEPGRWFILGGLLDPTTGKDLGGQRPTSGLYFNYTWLFYPESLSDGTTRMITRFRCDGRPRTFSLLATRVLLEPISFIMERKMLLNLQERIEAVAPTAGA